MSSSSSGGKDIYDRECFLLRVSCIVYKPVFEIFDKVQHKLGCIAITDGLRLEIWHLGSIGIMDCTTCIFILKTKALLKFWLRTH